MKSRAPLILISLVCLSSLVCLVAIALFPSIPSIDRFSNAPEREAEELDIREAVYRHQLRRNASGAQQNAYAYYFNISEGRDNGRNKDGIPHPPTMTDRDPPEKLISRFAGHRPPVRKRSECEMIDEKGVVDKATGNSGCLIFHTSDIRWISESEVEVTGGYYEGNVSSSGNRYHLKKEGGKWKVTKDIMQWIS